MLGSSTNEAPEHKADGDESGRCEVEDRSRVHAPRLAIATDGTSAPVWDAFGGLLLAAPALADGYGTT